MLTVEGLSLGLAVIKFWTRKKFKGAAALKRKVNSSQVHIEKKESLRWLDNLPQFTELFRDLGRCIQISDRVSDIYEFLCLTQEIGTHSLIRACHSRLAGKRDHTVAEEMDEVAIKGLHWIDVQDREGDPGQRVLGIQYRKLRVLPPIGKQHRYPALTLLVIHAEERGKSRNRTKIDWMLIADLPIRLRREAIEKLRWCGTRWKIAIFHDVLESGCKAEDSKLKKGPGSDQPNCCVFIPSWPPSGSRCSTDRPQPHRRVSHKKTMKFECRTPS